MNKIKFLFAALIAAVSFASCSEDEPARMLWEVSAVPSENVKAAFDPMFYHQIQITADGEGGEVTLKCINYKTLVINGVKNDKGEFVDSDCNFTAKITEPGIIKVTLGKMPDDFSETTSLLEIDGNDGKHDNVTMVDIHRKPSDK